MEGRNAIIRIADAKLIMSEGPKALIPVMIRKYVRGPAVITLQRTLIRVEDTVLIPAK